MTDAKGRYTLHRLADGPYKLQATDQVEEFASQWYPNAETRVAASEVVISDGKTVANVDFALAAAPAPTEPGKVIGKVVDKAGTGQRGGVVTAYRRSSDEWAAVDFARVGADGSYRFWSLPAGDYAFEFRDGSEEARTESQWHGGGYTLSQATQVTVAETGAVDLGTLVVSTLGTISGQLSLQPIPGLTWTEREVIVVNADGEPMEVSVDMDAKGRFAAKVPPGTYQVVFRGRRYTEDEGHGAEFITQWWKNAFSSTAARSITVGDGATVTGIDATLGHTLATVVRPKISGTATPGKRLTVGTGTWNRMADTRFTFEWKVGGVAAGTGAAYTVRAADRGKPVTVTVTARDRFDRYGVGSATTDAVVAKEVAKVSAP